MSWRSNYIIGILSLLLSASCIRDAKVVPPKVERQITLSCFISPDEDTVSAVVAWSKPLFTKGGNSWNVIPVQNATVIISGEKGSLSLTNFLPSESAPKYWAPQPEGFFEPGKTYTISVAEPGGKMITASTTIPLRKELNLRPLLVDSVTENSPWGGEKIFKVRLSLTFDDPPTPGDFYRVSAGYFNIFTRLEQDGDIFRMVKDSSYYPFYFNRSELYSDAWGNGNSVTFNTGQQLIYYYDGDFGSNDTGDFFYFVVLQTDETYFKFHRYAENYFGEDPFSEPNPMFTNVSGGQGIFGAYLRHVAALKVR